MVEVYYAAGFDALAITDHAVVDRSWTNPNFMPIQPWAHNFMDTIWPRGAVQGLTPERYAEISAGVDRDGRGMIRVPFGIEHNLATTRRSGLVHVNSWFGDFGHGLPGGRWDFSLPVRGVERAGGISMINHPSSVMQNWDRPIEELFNEGDYVVNKIQRDLERFDSLIGMEMHGARERKLWDALLTNLAPTGRNVFALSTDDAHNRYNINWAWTTHLMPENTAENLRTSLETGAFFAVRHFMDDCDFVEYLRENTTFEDSWTLEESWRTWNADKVRPVPRVTNITAQAGVISIETQHAEVIAWVADGEIIAFGNEIILADYLDDIGAYVRAEVWGEGGILYTQPFLLSYDGMPAGRPVPCNFRDHGDIFAFFRSIFLVPRLMYPVRIAVLLLEALGTVVRYDILPFFGLG